MFVENTSVSIDAQRRRRSATHEIRPSGGRGFGLYATERIAAGCEVLSCVARDLDAISPDIPFAMAQYLFVHPDQFDAQDRRRRYLMVCGDMVFLNHSDNPNCTVSWSKNRNGLFHARLVALHDTVPDEELTIQYTDACDYKSYGYF